MRELLVVSKFICICILYVFILFDIVKYFEWFIWFFLDLYDRGFGFKFKVS